MKEERCSPDENYCNTMIKGLLKNNDTFMAMQLLHEKNDEGFSRNACKTNLIVDVLRGDKLD